INHRAFLKTTAATAAFAAAPLKETLFPQRSNPQAHNPIAIASGNGPKALEKAMELMRQGSDALDAVVAGVNIVEDDPEDTSVGYGGLPNEDGIVELDAAVMHGPSYRGG